MANLRTFDLTAWDLNPAYVLPVDDAGLTAAQKVSIQAIVDLAVASAVAAVQVNNNAFTQKLLITPGDGNQGLETRVADGEAGLLVHSTDEAADVFGVEGSGHVRTNQVEALTPTDTTTLNSRMALFDLTGTLIGWIPLHIDVP